MDFIRERIKDNQRRLKLNRASIYALKVRGGRIWADHVDITEETISMFEVFNSNIRGANAILRAHLRNQAGEVRA